LTCVIFYNKKKLSKKHSKSFFSRIVIANRRKTELGEIQERHRAEKIFDSGAWEKRSGERHSGSNETQSC